MNNETSRLPIAVYRYRCERCSGSFHELEHAEMIECPHCGESLNGQQLETLDASSRYELRVDPISGQLYIWDTQTHTALGTDV